MANKKVLISIDENLHNLVKGYIGLVGHQRGFTFSNVIEALIQTTGEGAAEYITLCDELMDMGHIPPSPRSGKWCSGWRCFHCEHQYECESGEDVTFVISEEDKRFLKNPNDIHCTQFFKLPSDDHHYHSPEPPLSEDRPSH